MKNKLLNILVVTLLLLGCQENNIHICPEYTFIEPFPKRAIDLRKRLGEEFLVEKITKSNMETIVDPISGDTSLRYNFKKDTVFYAIKFNRSERTNTILDIEGDTVFHGLISVYRNLYYMSTQLADSVWWIGAMEIGIDSIRGLTEIWEQMCDLDFYIKGHSNCPMVYKADSMNRIYQLNPLKKQMKEYYSSVITDYKSFRIVDEQGDFGSIHRLPEKIFENEKATIVENKLAESLYPNPTHDKIQLELSGNDTYTISIIDNTGKVLMKKEYTGPYIDIELNDLNLGTYYIGILNTNSNQIEYHQVIVY